MDVRRLGRLGLFLAGLLLALTLFPHAAGAAIGEHEATRIADRDANVVDTERERGPLTTRTESKPEQARWEVGYFDDDEQVMVVYVDSRTGEVTESWTGDQVAWQMARGYEGSFGHKLNAPYVWLPLAAIFLCGLFDWRRPLRIVHLDLLVLLAFGVGQVFFNRGEIGVSVPLAYPVLVYLLARMLWLGLRGGGGGLRPSAPIAWLAIGAVFLCGFRVALNVADSGVIDVGYAGVVGADRIAAGEPLYGETAFPDEIRSGDTYGPANYYAYLPFELALPWSGEWDELPAGHAASIFFDLATVAGLFLCGGALRPAGRRGLWPNAEGRALGIVLAFAWLAYPYTAFALQSNSNDSLVAALLVWSLVLFASPWARGVLLGLAAMTKFAPLALAPLFAAGGRGLAGRARQRIGLLGRAELAFGLALVGALVLMLAHPAIEPGLATFWERTVSNQLERSSPFSIWGQEEGLGWLQTAISVGAIGFAIALAFLPRRRSLVQVAALGAAVLIAIQLAVDHWFYLYIPWFLPFLFAALAGERRDGD